MKGPDLFGIRQPLSPDDRVGPGAIGQDGPAHGPGDEGAARRFANFMRQNARIYEEVRPGVVGPDPEGRRASKATSLAFGAAVVILMGVGVWYSYVQGIKEGAKLQPPLIKAQPGDYKHTPDDPGGVQVPHQDKLVYERLDGKDGAAGPDIAKLLPPAEQPIDRPAPPPPPLAAKDLPEVVERDSGLRAGDFDGPPVFADPSAPAESAEDIVPGLNQPVLPGMAAGVATLPVEEEPLAPPVLDRPAAKPATTADLAKPDAKPAEAAAKPAESKSAEAAKPADPTKPAKPAESKTVAKAGAKPEPKPGSALIQLGSFRSQGQADQGWNAAKSKGGALLGNIPHQVKLVDLGPKGTFYRLQAGPVDSGQARKLCDQLTARKVNCLVVHP